MNSIDTTSPASLSHPDNDPHDWLEDVLGDRALAWVRERNAESESLLTARPRVRRSASSCWKC